MSKNARDRRPYIPPVTRIELSENNIRLRWILIVVLLSIAVVSIGMGLSSMLKAEPGWQEVEVSSSNINCSRDFVLMYEFGSGNTDATAEFKNVTSLYTHLTEQAYQLFTADVQTDLNNIYYLNQHVNEAVQVPQALYKALELVASYNCRYPFLAPVVKEYDPIFLAANDAEAVLYDPVRNEEQIAYMRESAAFAADPNMIRIELLGNAQVQLSVAQEYLAYAREHEIEVFLDLGWMKNAFIADYLADMLASSGYTNGYIASFDGFTRNLDSRGEGYSFNLFDRRENTISIPARLNYNRSMSIVSLRNYPLSEEDRWHYYAFEDGTIASVYLDPADGVSRSSTDNLVSYSEHFGCAEILMQTAPIFIAEELDQTAVDMLAAAGIHSIWGEDNVLLYTEADADVELLPESGGADYRLQPVQ